MAASKDLITRIILKGQQDPSLAKAFKGVDKLTDGSIGKLSKFGNTVKSIMGKAAKVTATAAIAGATASVKSAIDYESAFAGVMKTVNETGTTTYEDLSKGIINMSKRMPATASEIAAVAESAGQLGIKADDILKFSETMVNLGETTNLSSEEAASSIAKMFNITGTSMKDVDKFGATLVALGNNAATTESDILNMASRIAAGGSQIGLTEQQILALSTTLSSVGLEAEGGGTAISTVLANIDKDVATNADTLSTWASLAGVSAGEFKKLWASDTFGAVQKVIGGLGDATKGGANMNVMLDELGISGIRTTDTMKRLTNASGLLGDMTNLANKAWDEGNALQNEANVRYATMASKIDMAKNKITALGISVGNKLMPYVDKLMDKFNNIDFDAVAEKIGVVIDKIAAGFKWISDNSTVIVGVVAGIAGAFAGIKILGIVTSVIKLVKVFMGITKIIGVAKMLGLALAAIGGPVTIVVGLIAGLVAAFVALWFKSEAFRNFWINLWNKVKDAAAIAGNWLKNFFTVTIPTAFNAFVNKCKSVGAAIKNFFTVTIPQAFNKVVTFFQQLPGKIGAFFVSLINRINTWRLSMIAKAKEIGLNFINTVVNFFKQLPYKIGYAIGAVIGTLASWAVKLYQFATTKIPQFINAVVNWFKQLPGRIWTWLTNTVNKVTAWGARMIAIGKQKAIQFVTAYINFVRALPGKIWTFLSNVVSKVISWGARMVSIGRQKALQFINAVINFFRTLPGKIWTWLVNAAQKVVSWGTQLAAKGRAAAQNLLTAIVSKAKEIPGKMLEVGKNIVKGLWNGINDMVGWVKGKIKSFSQGVLDGIKEFFKVKSPSRVMAALGKFLPMGLGNGIVDNSKYAINGIKEMGGKVISAASKISPTITPTISNIAGKVRAFANGGTVTSPEMAVVGDAPETIVPHGNTPRNRSLLREAAAGVGASMGGKNKLNFTFAPVINGGNAEENRRMLEEEEAEFERKMDEYFAKKGRLAFS